MTTEYLKLTEMSSNPQEPDTVVNTILREIESRFHVKSRTNGGPPASPANGHTYIVDSVTGAWSYFTLGQIARYYSSTWYAVTPGEGWNVWCDDEDVLLSHDGTRWREAPIRIVAMQDFSQDPGTTTGLTFGYRAGRVRNDSAVTDVSAGTVALTASGTNYVELTGAGTVLANTSAYTSGRIPLYTVVTDGSGITSVTDRRTWVSLGGGAGGGGSSLGDFDEDSGTTTGLTWGYQAGSIRLRTTVTSVSAGTVALTDNNTNYVEIDSGGTVTANTTGFTAGKIPLRQVTTVSGSQTASTDRRAWIPFVVEGPATGTDNAWPRQDGATGRILQDGKWVEADSGDVTAGGHLDMNAKDLKRPILRRWIEGQGTATLTTGTLTLDCTNGPNFAVTLNQNVTTVSITNLPSGTGWIPLTIELTQDATGGRTVSGWPSGTKWPGGSAPTISAAAAAVDVIAGYTRDAATTWRLGRAFEDSK
ncbi:DUF2793 domain-containing protein [Thioalbus denitrificans]|uniref:Uncharacterized protein DUF2793 n=1 Tax=Thioalbus denitrificans TaxID=547122 RepID=A0A369CI04_9GAMM|nr:DUF2793 domain-containing protein [Thioalbus denitrificans]RCX32087.1 uncharacterized protein DUF2793 [Thioalbus denitrificans]